MGARPGNWSTRKPRAAGHFRSDPCNHAGNPGGPPSSGGANAVRCSAGITLDQPVSAGHWRQRLLRNLLAA